MMKVMTWQEKCVDDFFDCKLSVEKNMANRRQREYSHIEDENEQRTVQLQLKVKRLKDIVIEIDQETRYQINELTVC